MSLINDVLRQVDSRSNAKGEMAYFLPTALTPKKDSRNTSKIFFLVVSSLLVLFYIFQLIVNKPLFNNDVDYSSTTTHSISPVVGSIASADIVDADIVSIVPSEMYDLDIEAGDSIKIKEQYEPISLDILNPNQEPVKISERLVAYAEPDISALIVPAEVVSTPAVRTKVVQPRAVTAPVSQSKAYSPVVVKAQNEVVGDKEYQRALGYFISGDIEKSDSLIKQVLAENKTEESLALQARIFIKKKDADSFYSLVKSNPDNNSITWYKLIAPGLQLFSYYDLSNQYYYALLNIEPEQIRWQLAIALNQVRLGKEDKAIAIYKELSQSDQVSSRQKQWLIRKIERLTLSKA
jgi:hypothetical protein